jgi:thiol-disulfide isomerase/thioredoxin
MKSIKVPPLRLRFQSKSAAVLEGSLPSAPRLCSGNTPENRRKPAVSALGFALVFLLSMAFATAKASQAEEVEITSFGKGKVRVRLYTDYFCGPCSRMEPRIESLLSDLVKRNVITLTFVDTPVHRTTTIYAKYFLYTCNADRAFASVLRSRAILFEAAKNGIEDKEKLEEFLGRNKVKFKEVDAGPIFTALTALINEDGIRSTPTCVIIRDGKKGVFSGESDITKALDLLG